MNIPVGAQVFDLVFHPTHSRVYTGLLTGEVKAFKYDEGGQHESTFTLKPSKRSCRGLTISEDGMRLWAVGKGKGLCTIDTNTGQITETRFKAHDAAINRVKHIMPWVLSTGDDNGVIKLWDPRRQESIRSYGHHFDYITDFLWLGDKKQLVATSGDGTLSVMDIRSKKSEPFAQSEDQEDELLSILAIKGGAKFIVGTQLGILSIFNRASGWGDCVDRVPGHPQSVDALCAVPPSFPMASSTILTGSSDGLLRAVQIFPTKLVGVVADHGNSQIERIAVDKGGEGTWVGSAGHDEVLRMTDLRVVFGGEDKVEQEEKSEAKIEDNLKGEVNSKDTITAAWQEDAKGSDEVNGGNSECDEPSANGKRKRKREKVGLIGKSKRGRNDLNADAAFFAEL